MKTFAQDSIPAAADFTEEKELKFQDFFFNALSQKSIGNYQKALENLESCNQLLPNNSAVFFEFSKNYLYLNNMLLAKEYIHRAIEKDVNNIWMQKHLVKVFIREQNFYEAIKIQQKIVVLNPKEKEYLVKLYFQNRDYENTSSLLNDLEKDDMLSLSLRQIKEHLVRRTAAVVKPVAILENSYKKFKRDKTYPVLEQILEDAKNRPKLLLEYSSQGIALFPAQPFVYLVQGRALNKIKEYKKALKTLKNGIDFVIEDAMEAKFYKEMATSYKGLGNKIEEEKYKVKYKKMNN
jgi:tetratricopeptide (TPR) repeat protein